MQRKYQQGDLINIIGTDCIDTIQIISSNSIVDCPYALRDKKDWYEEFQLQHISTYLQERYMKGVEYLPIDFNGMEGSSTTISNGVIKINHKGDYFIGGLYGYIYANGKLAEVIDKKQKLKQSCPQLNKTPSAEDIVEALVEFENEYDITEFVKTYSIDSLSNKLQYIINSAKAFVSNKKK